MEKVNKDIPSNSISNACFCRTGRIVAFFDLNCVYKGERETIEHAVRKWEILPHWKDCVEWHFLPNLLIFLFFFISVMLVEHLV